MKVAVHPLVDDYVHALEDAARRLPRKDREELVEQIREHIDAALPAEPTEADVRNVLDALGSPRDIVAAAGGQAPRIRRGAREAFALVLLVVGLPPILGWAVGLGLLLWSPLWSARQKLLGALVWPGGLLTVFLALALPFSSSATLSCSGSTLGGSRVRLAASSTCTSTSSGPPAVVTWLLVAVLVAAPLLVAGYLWRAAGRRSAA